MEELRSTEILDREIEADAKRKAEKIILQGKEECEKILAAVDERVNQSVQEKKAFYENKLELYRKNADAAIPLEKERFLISFYDEKVCEALNEYLESMGPEKRLSLLEKQLEKIRGALSDTNVDVSFFGVSEASAKKLAAKATDKKVLSVTEISFEVSGQEAEKGNNFHEGLIIQSEDKSVKIRLTMDQLLHEVKENYFYEMSTTLFGGKLPE